MAVVLVTAPTVEPISAADFKLHARIDGTDEDTYIESLISAVRMAIEQHTGRALISQTWDYWSDDVPETGIVKLPKPPLLSVTSITTYSDADVATVFSTSSYRVDVTDTMGGRVCLKSGAAWPGPVRITSGFNIRFVAGYGTTPESVPDPLRQAIKSWVSHFYELREPVNVGNITSEIPNHFLKLLWPYKTRLAFV